MGTHNINFSEQFEFTGKVKTLSIVGIALGIAAVAYGFIAGDKVMHERTFARIGPAGNHQRFALPTHNARMDKYLAPRFLRDGELDVIVKRVDDLP